MTRRILAALLLIPLAACITVERDISPEIAARSAASGALVVSSGSPRQMVNAARAQAGLPPLARSPHLDRAAVNHAGDMARNDFYGHRSFDGGTVRDRVEATGYGSCRRSENIASGQANEQVVTRAWINSPSHRANILDPKATHIGFAGMRDPDGPNDPLWVMVLATRTC